MKTIRTVTYCLIPKSFVAGCIRRSDDIISEDYDEIDRRNPPVFINNTRTQIVVAEGKDARLDCRVSNVGDRTVRAQRLKFLHNVLFNLIDFALASGDFCNPN